MALKINKLQKIIRNAKSIHKIQDFVLDVLFPIECLGCSESSTWLCKKCFRKLKINTKQICSHCHQNSSFGKYCSKCKQHYYLNGIWIAGNYEDRIISKLIKTLKYHFAYDLASVLGSFLSLFFKNLINQANFIGTDLDSKLNINKFNQIKKSPQILTNLFLKKEKILIISIPLHKKRERWRGFNQSQILAKILAKNFNIKFNNELLRIKHKTPQANLDRENRLKNIQKCFMWNGNNLINHDIILVDDVTTTGSTLNEAARILKANGANEVWGLVLASGG